MTQEGKAAVHTARILLVDDAPDTLNLLKHLLSQRYQVEVVTDWIAAVEQLKHLPDLVLADVMMMRLDGFEVLRSLRADPQTNELPIILLSEQAEEEACIAGLEAGADDYVTKTFSERELLARIEANLRRARSRQDAARRERELRAESVAAQRKAEATRDQISNILESITDAFVAFDRQWRYTYVNQQATRLLQKTREELIGKHVWEEVFPEEVGKLAYQKFHRAVNEQVAVVFEEFGQPIGKWLEIHAYPSPDGLAVYFRDITDAYRQATQRKQAEETLRQREAELTLITDALPVLISFVDSEQRYRFNNRGYEEWFGRPATEVYGKHLWEVLGKPAYEAIRPYVEQVLAGQHVTYESQVSYVIGETRYISATYVPQFDSQGNVKGFVALVSDISDRKRMEMQLQRSNERFELAAAAVNCLIYDWDIEQDTVERTEGLTRILGYSLAEAGLTSKWWRERVHPEDLQRIQDEATTALTKGNQYAGEYRIRNKDNQYIYVLDQGLVVARDADGRPMRVVGSTTDISDRKRAEELLRQSEERFQAFMNNSPAAAWITDAEGRIVYLSQTYFRLFEFPTDDAIGKSIFELYPAEIAQQFLDNIKTVAQTNQVTEAIEVAPRTDGTRGDFLVYKFPIADASGQRLVGGVAVDITERKRTEEALQKSEEFNRKIIESSYDCIKVLDLDARLVSMSHRGMELLNICDFTPFFNSAWLEFWQGTDREAAQAAVESAKSGGIGRFQGYCPTMTGTPKWWDVLVTPILDTDGKPERLLSVARDITKRKQVEEALRHSEERYRYLTESIPQLVWTANAEGVLLDVNQRWLDYTGLTLAQAQIEGWQAIVHPDDVLILSERWAAAQQDGIHYQAEGRMRRVDGVYRWHLHQAVPMKNERGQVIKWFGTATDIEDQKRLEQQRDLILQQEQAAREEAERANRIKDEFLAVLSHELRSPLNPILGWSKLLRSRKLDEKTTNRALETIERSAQVQTQLIEDLLDVSRILQGKLSLNVCPVDLTSIIQAAMETVHLAAVAKSIQIQTWLEPDVGYVSGDPSRLQQVVWNLLSNAVKFTPPGGQVDIRLERLDSQAQIIVSDTGKGIDSDFLPHVFGYFRQSDSTTTRKFGGLGLGLAIARNLVELHGGTLQAESPGEGQGATFRVRLPLISTQPRTNQDSRRSEQSLDLNGLKLLVVDDDASTREFFTFLLELHGASVTAVGSAGEAFTALTQSKPDVLLSDIGMPEVDGYMLMQQVRTLPPEQGGQIPAIALTAYAGEINYQQALSAGFQQHVSKPVEPAKLVEVIANLVGQSK